MTNTAYASVSDDIKKKISNQLIERALIETRFYDLAKKEMINAGHGKTIYFYKYPDLDLPSSTVTEGTDPTAQAMSNSEVTATAEQWGNVIAITDIAELTINTPLMQEAMKLLSRQASKIIDREIQEVLNAGTNVAYATAVSARSSLTTSTILTSSDIINAVAGLRDAGAMSYEGDAFVGVLDPAIEADIRKDTAVYGFAVASAYAGDLVPLKKGEIGMWAGVRWVRSNFIPYLERATQATGTGGSVASGGLDDDDYYVGFVYRTASNDQVRKIALASAGITVANGAGKNKVTVTCPSDTDYEYDVYIGTAADAMYLNSQNNAAGASVVLTALPTSGLYPIVPAASVKVHTTYIFGKDSFACSNLQNLSFHITPNSPDSGNVLELVRKMGFKMMFKSVILENDYFTRIESHSKSV